MSDLAATAVGMEMTSTSRLKTWFMVHFRGYSVVLYKEIPRVTRRGRLTYEYRWYLRATTSGQ